MNLSIIILNWKSYSHTRACLRSLFQCTQTDWTVRHIVVDNGSGDDSLAKLRREFGDEVDFVAAGENLGYSGGNNLGIRQALADGADLVLLLNNDTTVDKNFLKELRRSVAQHSDFQLFGAKIFYHVRPHTLWYAGGGYTEWLGKIWQTGMGDADGPQYQTANEISFINGCCLLIKREVFESIGYLDDDLYLYGEDLDFCMRAKRAGLRMLFVPQARLWHHIGAFRGGELSPLYLYYHTRNRYIVFGREHGLFFRMWLAFLQITLYSGVRTFLFLMSRNRVWPQQIRALWHGCLDGFLHRLGPTEMYHRDLAEPSFFTLRGNHIQESPLWRLEKVPVESNE